ncbi:hypothetical protein [Rodentibacter caecimuris]|nr:MULTISPECIES: hypothetical protein [Pasteurellaceae]AOF53273.1 hypothetical protein AC062_1180 [Pasteurellaceae bacterium NI1060]MCR1838412.1 hypothetical protein [Pasteurella caecimuris]MCX2962124.1 hypothetical protein [Rodentibacter heylii]
MLNVDLACEPYGNAINMIRSFIGTFTRNTQKLPMMLNKLVEIK